MPLPSLPAAWSAPHPDLFVAVGDGADVDEAYDDAVSRAWHDHGHSPLVTTITATDPATIAVSGAAPATLGVQALMMRRTLETAASGVVVAAPVCVDSAMRRRRATLRSTDPALELGAETGPLVEWSESVDAWLRAELELGEADQVEAVTLTSVRRRYKPVVAANKGRTLRSFAAIHPASSTIVTSGHPTATAARRAVVEMMKAGAVAGDAAAHVEVVAMLRREGDVPFVAVRRERVAQRATVKVSVVSPKTETSPKVAGWLFWGRVGVSI